MADRVHPKQLGKDRHTSDGNQIFEPAGQTPIINGVITQNEDANLKAYGQAYLSQLSLSESSIPNRPAYGNKGTAVALWTNNMEIFMTADKSLFTYEIVIDDRLTIKRKRREFMEDALRRLPELRVLGYGVATDYMSLIVTSEKIDIGPSDCRTFKLDSYDTALPGDRVTAPHGKPFKLQISLIGSLCPSDFRKFTDPSLTSPVQTEDTEAVRALNIIMASFPNKEPDVYQGNQNEFFRYPSDEEFSNFDLEAGLIAVRGYFCSVRFSTSRILLNLNSRCTPFYKAVNARILVQDFQRSAPGDCPALEHFLLGLRVEMSYRKAPDGVPTRMRRTVNGFFQKEVQHGGTGKAKFRPGNANEIMFKPKGNQPEKTVSVKEYFLAEYGLTLKDPGGIVLNCGTKDNPSWIPAELCTVIAGQPYRGGLNGNQTTRMLAIASRPPAENAYRIMAEDGGLGLIGVLPKESQYLATFGIKINPEMIVVPGRVLNSPKVTYSGQAKATMRGASWNLKEREFVKAATVLPWAMLRIGDAAKIPVEKLKEQYDSLTTGFKQRGLKIGEPFRPESGLFITNLNDKSIVNSELRSVFEKCKNNGIGMLYVILPSEDSWLYDRIKYWGDVRYGVQTVCQQMSKFSKSDIMTSANIALKLNLKSGGTNHVLSRGDLGFLEEGKTMLVGIDVTHPTGCMKGTPSIAGVVASIDSNFSQFPGSIRSQQSRKEMVSELDLMMEERLELWVSKNVKQKLENIIVYRDGKQPSGERDGLNTNFYDPLEGVSEGQYKIVLGEEVPAIKRASAKVFKDGVQPNITFIVVGKNHHNRLYPTSKKTANQKRNCNVQSGTVVDRGITMPKGWDFFLVAHEPLAGTAKPAHYTIILDEIKDSKKFGANELEKITHNLCYTYGRATKAVSICPPAYYAHLICLRARCYISNYVKYPWGPEKVYDENESPWHSGGVHESFKDNMFYI